jgi:hypothetical protein
MSTESTILPKSGPPFFDCKSCDFKCSKKRDWDRHLLTRKHLKSTEINESSTKNPQKASDGFSCEKCGKVYKERTGLWRHNKKCIKAEELLDSKKKEIEEIKNENEVILLLLKENQEFKQMMVEQNKQNADLQKQLLDLAKETKITTINNTNNNKFNMNIFLNEKCKDALNIMDFVNSLQLQLQDLEKTSELGYVNGISRIFINGLKQLDVYKRPIHCSDVKRETLYVKDNDTWEKEDTDKKKITRAIRHVSIRNAKQVSEWTKENKGYNDSSNKKSDKYLKIVSEANGGEPEELNKIIKNISTNVIIDKNEI